MSTEQLEQSILAAGINTQRVMSRDTEVRVSCPFCSEDRFRCYLNPDKGVYFCFNCSRHGKLKDALQELGVAIQGRAKLSSLRKWAKKRKKKKEQKKLLVIPLPLGYEPLEEDRLYSPMLKRAANYLLEKRGLNWKTIRQWKIGCCLDGDLVGFLIFPIWNAEGEQVGYQTRRYFALGSRYKDPPSSPTEYSPRDMLYGIHLWSQRKKTLVVVEGPFDAISVNRRMGKYDILSVALLGGNLSWANMMLLHELDDRVGLEKTIVLLDADARRKAKSVKTALKRVLGGKLKMVVPECDPDELGIKSLKKILLGSGA